MEHKTKKIGMKLFRINVSLFLIAFILVFILFYILTLNNERNELQKQFNIIKTVYDNDVSTNKENTLSIIDKNKLFFIEIESNKIVNSSEVINDNKFQIDNGLENMDSDQLDGYFKTNKINYYGIYYVIESNHIIFIGKDDAIIKSVIYQTIFSAVLLAGVLLGLASFLTLRITRKRINEPINKLIEINQRLIKGEILTDVQHQEVKDEINLLNNYIIDMINSSKYKNKLLLDVANGKLTYFEESNDELLNSIVMINRNLNQFNNEIQNIAYDIMRGNFLVRLDSNKYSGKYAEIINGINVIIDNLVFQLDNLPNPLITMDRDLNVLYINKIGLNYFNTNESNVIGKPYQDILGNASHEADNCLTAIQNNQVMVGEMIFNNDNLQEYILKYTIVPILDTYNNVVGVYNLLNDETKIYLEQIGLELRSNYNNLKVNELNDNLTKLATGQFDLSFEFDDVSDNLKELEERYNSINSNLNNSVQLIGSYITDIKYVLSNIASNNLDIDVDKEYVGEFKNIKDSLVNIIDSLNNVTSLIMETTDSVDDSTRIVDDLSISLSKAAVAQSQTLEEISVTINNIYKTVIDNTEDINQVNTLTSEAQDIIDLTYGKMNNLLQQIADIEDNSRHISKVLKLINDISFQTNILSLNAAVEAARAGEAGKGFAVIAEDIRNLALKTNKAADESSDIIKSMLHSIELGHKLTNDTHQSLNELLNTNSRIVKLNEKITDMSNQSSDAISEVKSAINQITDVVVKTSNDAKLLATQSNNLKVKTKDLMTIIQNFKLKKTKMYSR